MRVRALDADNDMQFGRGALNFYQDQPEAPAQVVLTRLQLYLGEYFLDTNDGTPWNTQVLGKRTGDTRDPVIRSRILGTPGVTEITRYGSTLDRNTRAYVATATIATAYGPTTIRMPL